MNGPNSMHVTLMTIACPQCGFAITCASHSSQSSRIEDVDVWPFSMVCQRCRSHFAAEVRLLREGEKVAEAVAANATRRTTYDTSYYRRDQEPIAPVLRADHDETKNQGPGGNK